VFLGFSTQSFQKTGFRRHTPHISGNRFHNNARDFISLFLHKRDHCFRVIVRQRNRMFHKTFGNPRTSGNSQSCHTRPGFHEQGICMTMIAAVKFDNGVPACVCPCQPDRAHGGLGAGTDQPHHFHRGNSLNNHLCQPHFQNSGRAKTGSLRQHMFQKADHLFVPMSQNHGTP